MQSQKSFIIQLLAISFFMEIIALGWMYAMPPAWVSPTLWIMPLFFMLVTFFIHKSFLGALNKNARQFATRYMLITTIKLLSFLVILFTYAVVFRDDAIPFLIGFFATYLVYSGFEAVAVIKLNKNYSN